MTVVGIGNPYRRDDGVGLEVARLLRDRPPPAVTVAECEGEPTALLTAWEDADAAWIIDAAHPGAGRFETPAGTVHRMVVTDDPLPANLLAASTHALGLADAIEISRALGRLPEHVVIYAIFGRDFTAGEGLTPAVAAAAHTAAAAIRAETKQHAAHPAAG